MTMLKHDFHLMAALRRPGLHRETLPGVPVPAETHPAGDFFSSPDDLLPGHEFHKVMDAATVTPLVVVACHKVHHPVPGHLRVTGIQDG